MNYIGSESFFFFIFFISFLGFALFVGASSVIDMCTAYYTTIYFLYLYNTENSCLGCSLHIILENYSVTLFMIVY